ncbi:MAG: EAL domain-containing protein [Burkholderiaceae bacterium]|nr:EAL domain-containing protein [Burkholderiaceae bacterium]
MTLRPSPPPGDLSSGDLPPAPSAASGDPSGGGWTADLLRQALLQERAEHARLRSLADHVPLMLGFHEAGTLRCSYANEPYAHAFGFDVMAILGRSLPQVLGEELAQQVQPFVAQALRSGQRCSCEQEVELADGRRLWSELSFAPQHDAQGRVQGLFVLLGDLTRHRAAERAMIESEERLAKFMQASVEGILFHRDGRIADANPSICELLGQTLHELLGRRLLDLVAPEQRSRVAHVMAAGKDATYETALMHRDGSRLPVEFIERSSLQHGLLMRMTIVRDVRDRHATQARLHYLAHHDALTGLPNRAAFLAQLEHLMVAARAAGTQLALLFIDLDHFERVNDSVGHTAGDALLKTVARRIGEQVRSTDRTARFGGDEFMLLLPGVRDPADVIHVANKLLTAVSAPLAIEGRPISVTPSMGIALYPRDGETPDMLIKHADAAMHVAKARGRATYAIFEPQVATSAYANLVLEGQLGHAIEHGEFALRFQPQVRTCDGEPVGVEALIRWQHPERGLLAPDEFIALAEQHRLIVPIGAWVLQEAARCARHWHRHGLDLTVAVNLSTLQFQAPGFVESIGQLLEDSDLPAGWLELELTERMLMDDVPAVRERLHRLRALGVRLSVDDFGTGYSSLAHLKELPIDKMKIDRSFVRELPGQRQACAIARTIIQLADGLGLGVVAEGVETEAQQRFLAEAGCGQLQGLGISAPLGATQLETWVRERRAALRAAPQA